MSSRIWSCLRATALVVVATLAGGAAAEDTAVATIPAFQALFGTHPGYRPVHTKGLVAEGVFVAAPGAATLSSAAHLAGGPVPVIVRLSNFAGTPGNPDAGPLAAPHGMAVKFLLPDSDTDLVAHSYDGFPAATPGDFLEFLRALAAGDAGALPGEGTLGRYLAAHPPARAFLDATKPPPVSWANESFFGVNAFRFVDGEGHGRFGRYRILPTAGDARLTAAEAAAMDPDYLRHELTGRLAGGAVTWRIVVQLAAEGDRVEDGSVRWPADRPVVELGTLRLERLVPDSLAAERKLMFSPLNLVAGIEPSSDPMLAARARAYGESYRRRTP